MATAQGLIRMRTSSARSCLMPMSSGTAMGMMRRGLVSASVPLQAGQRHRLMQGRGRSGNEDGAFHDAPDWEYADGTPAPESQGRMAWQLKRESTEDRIERLREEVIEMEMEELERRSFGVGLVPTTPNPSGSK